MWEELRCSMGPNAACTSTYWCLYLRGKTLVASETWLKVEGGRWDGLYHWNVSDLRQGVFGSRQIGAASESPFGWKAFLVRTVWKGFLRQTQPRSAYSHALWRPAFFMPAMWSHLPLEVAFTRSPPSTFSGTLLYTALLRFFFLFLFLF